MTIRSQFRWNTLTVTFAGAAPATELTPTAALDRATVSLKRWGAKVTPDEAHGILRFGATIWSGRSWLSTVRSAQVSAASRGDSTVVEVSASLAPLVIMVALFAVVATAVGLPIGLLIGVLVFGANYAFVDFGMRRILRETLS